MIYYIVALLMIAIDQITKRLVVLYMNEGDSISVIGEFFQLTSHRNRGAAFGILQGQRWFFIVATTVVVIGIIWYIGKLVRQGPGNRRLKTALGLLLGGALGNFIDRLLFGEVVDFFHFHFEFSLLGLDVDYSFAIFNVADPVIFCGVALIFLDSLLAWNKERRGRMHEQGQA